MKLKQAWLNNPAVWTIGAVVAIGAVALGARGIGSPAKTTALNTIPAPAVSVSSERTEMMVDLKALDRSFQALAEAAAPAVVHIRTQGRSANVFGASDLVEAEGSGFIFRPDGYVITNDHVVGGMDKVTVVLHDGREFEGKVIRAEESDIAVVKIDAKDLPTLRFANSKDVRVGQLGMAIGAPFGLENSVTYGHVSALNRTNEIPDPRTGTSRRYFDLIQTDTPINKGNSGGPLINVDGEVIGINSAIFSLSGGSNGIGFAISANTARTLAETLIEKGRVKRGYLGIAPTNLKEYERKKFGIGSGAILREVESNGPAAAAGLKENDVIVKIGAQDVADDGDLRRALFAYEPGSEAKVEYVRGGEKKSTTVRVAEPPTVMARQAPSEIETPDQPFPLFKDNPFQGDPSDKSGRPKLGVTLQNLDSNLRSQFKIPNDVNGVVVSAVVPGSFAERFGLKPGDVITQFDGKTVTKPEEIVDMMSKKRSGQTVSLGFTRVDGSGRQQQMVQAPLP
jgi:serine protease Do